MDAIDGLPIPPSEDDLRTSCRAAELPEKPWLEEMLEIWSSIQSTSDILKDTTSDYNPSNLGEIDNSIVSKLQEMIDTLENEGAQYEADAKKFDRNKASEAHCGFLAKRWVFEHSDEIQSDLQRLQLVEEKLVRYQKKY